MNYGYTALGASEDVTEDTRIAYNAGVFTGINGSKITGGFWRGRRSTGSGNSNIWLGLYSDGSGSPGSRLDMITGLVTLNTTVQTYYIRAAGSFSLVTGTTYWIAASSDLGVDWRCSFDSNAAYDMSFVTTSTGALPASWGTESGSDTWKLGFYFVVGSLVRKKTFAQPGSTTYGNMKMGGMFR